MEILLVKQWLALGVSILCASWGSEEDVSAVVLTGRDPGRRNEENSKDYESENPLKGNDLDEELLYGQGYTSFHVSFSHVQVLFYGLEILDSGQLTQCQDAQRKPEDSLLQGENMVPSGYQKYPDEDIGDDPRSGTVTGDGYSPVPE